MKKQLFFMGILLGFVLTLEGVPLLFPRWLKVALVSNIVLRKVSNSSALSYDSMSKIEAQLPNSTLLQFLNKTLSKKQQFNVRKGPRGICFTPTYLEEAMVDWAASNDLEAVVGLACLYDCSEHLQPDPYSVLQSLRFCSSNNYFPTPLSAPCSSFNYCKSVNNIVICSCKK